VDNRLWEYSNCFGGKIRGDDNNNYFVLKKNGKWSKVTKKEIEEFLNDYKFVNVINRPAIWFIFYELIKGKPYNDIRTYHTLLTLPSGYGLGGRENEGLD
jgi:hypothetical protein